MAAVAPVAHDKLDGPRYCKRNPLAQVRKPPEDASGESCERHASTSTSASGRQGRDPDQARLQHISVRTIPGRRAIFPVTSHVFIMATNQIKPE